MKSPRKKMSRESKIRTKLFSISSSLCLEIEGRRGSREGNGTVQKKHEDTGSAKVENTFISKAYNHRGQMSSSTEFGS